jgi:hypothetical protein
LESSWRESWKTATVLVASALACWKPSEYNITSAISSLSGLDMATARKSAVRLSGSLERPP